MQIKQAALIGMGAVGTVYAKQLHHTYGSHFGIIAKGNRGEKLLAHGAMCNAEVYFPKVLASEKDFSPDLIIICVKNYQLDAATNDLHEFVGKDTILLPLLNGITARDRLLQAFPQNRVFYGTVNIEATRTDAGVTSASGGIIRLGYADNTEPLPEVLAVEQFLTAASIRAEINDDMIRTVWKKWMTNVTCNQISAVTGATYGQIASIPSNMELLHDLGMEIVALAKASNVNLNEQDLLQLESAVSTFSKDSKTSMLQDIEAGRKTEVDYFGGTAVELGQKLNVPTPVNRTVSLLIQSLEAMCKPHSITFIK